MIKVSDLIALKLKEENIKVAFGIIGSANAHIFDSIRCLGFTELICLHHEQAAIMAMASYFRATGKLAVSIVTAGAGASNSITGVLSNWADSIPGVIISGQEPSRYLVRMNGRMYGTQGFNSTKMVKEITKYSKCILNANEMLNELDFAFNITNTGRPGPVWLEVPFDIQSNLVEKGNFNKKVLNHLGTSIEDNYAADIVKYLGFSKKPVILVGNGVNLSNSRKEIEELLDKLDIPFMSSWSGIDIISNKHEKYFGRFGLYGQRHANFIIQKADLIICLGTRLAIPQVGYQISEFAPKAKIIVVDIDENELNKYERFIKINYNVKFILKALNRLITKKIDRLPWMAECIKIREMFPLLIREYTLQSEYVNSYLFLNKFSKQIPQGDIVVTDMGTALLSGHQVMEVDGYRMYTSQGLGEMGVGLPYAIGASVALRERDSPGTVHCLNCDGGIMMNLQELQTLVNLKPSVKIIIFNNLGYLMIKHTQKMLFNGQYTAVDKDSGVDFPDFEKLANAFGFGYLKMQSINDYDKVMCEYFSFQKSVILEVFMDPEQDFIPKVKGVPVAQSSEIFSPPLEEMSPLLDLEIVKAVMGPDISLKSLNINRLRE